MSEPLSGWPLSVALAERLGWQRCVKGELLGWVGRPSGGDCRTPIPAYHESLDALFRDVVPALRAKEFWVNTGIDSRQFEPFFAVFYDMDRDYIARSSNSTAEALCRAALLALEGSSDE